MSVRSRRWVRRALVALALAAVLGGLGVVVAVRATPFPVARLAPTDVEARRVLDRHGTLLRVALSDRQARGAWRTLDQVSPWLPRAFVAIEDRRFFEHPGVDWRGVARAAWSNLRAGRVVAGGSTLTQQVVQRIMPAARTLRGKASEALWALRLERAVDKAEIMTQYLNRVPMGHGAIGVEAGARRYLGKSADAVSLAEAALLAGIPRAPSRDNPLTDAARAVRRQRSVLRQMHQTGAIDAAQLQEALAEPLRFPDPLRTFAAPHFTRWVLARGPRPGDVHTTLDGGLQTAVEAEVRRAVRALAAHHVQQGAAVVLDNATGDILAWVGSVDFFAADAGQVDMVLGLRQPGSTLKPFLYGLGFEGDVDESTRIPDVALHFPTPLGDYRPRNYDGKFHGWVSPRAALANSYNVPAVWMAQRVGVAPFLARLRSLGLDRLGHTADYYGLGLALGNGEVRLLALTNAYRALANAGRYSPPRWERDAAAQPAERVMPAAVARLVTDILADPSARAPAFGTGGPLRLPFPAAAKTGTSADFTDNWTVGYTDSVTVGVWVGNFDGRPMRGVSGVTGAGPLWNAVMRLAMRGRPPPELTTEGLEPRRLCRATGAPFGPGCAHAVEGLFLRPTTSAPSAPTRLRFVHPGEGDTFAIDPDRPVRYAQLRMRAEAPAGQRLGWSVDGVRQEGEGAAIWWTPSAGAHRAQVWLVDDPAERREVRFEVFAPGDE